MTTDTDIRKPTSDDTRATMTGMAKVKDDTLIELSSLTLPEIQGLKEEVANILPAGNLPGMLLSGLTNLKGRRVSQQRVRDDIKVLFKSADYLPAALYAVLYGGPAVVLSAYQSLLTMTGKDIETAFPEGTWQFYLQFGLREDTGRHTCETVGFHRDRPRGASAVDDITAWIMTAVHTLIDTDTLNGAIWTEWTTLRLLREAAKEAGLEREPPFANISRRWQAARPYRISAGVSYALERQAALEKFARRYFEYLSTEQLQQIGETLQELGETERPAYQRQMSLRTYLEPGVYSDERIPIPLWETRVALVHQSKVFLFDVCARDEAGLPLAKIPGGESFSIVFDAQRRPLSPDGTPLEARGSLLYRTSAEQGDEMVGHLIPSAPELVKGMVQEIISQHYISDEALVDFDLVSTPRSMQQELRGLLSSQTQASLNALAYAPILINWDDHNRDQPLGDLRREAQRGVGDHPLSVMRTNESIVFDLSHIFFDGVWGMAMAEVMTNQAVAWCEHVRSIQPAANASRLESLSLTASTAFKQRINDLKRDRLPVEIGVETDTVDMDALQRARRRLARRGPELTINDFLLLGRVIHAAYYAPADNLSAAVHALDHRLRQAVKESLAASSGINPALLIPMDASLISPRERVYPTTFRNGLDGLIESYEDAVTALADYQEHATLATWRTCKETRALFFSFLNGFGEMLAAIKAIALRGESFNTATLRMLAHLPESMQHLLNQIPQKFGVLNEIVKGEEVFSNVGRVAQGASLTRFMSAKDDGQAKKLVWGIMTDDNDIMLINLRDFRAHVPLLLEAGHIKLARKLARDYVESYAMTVNALAAQIIQLAEAEGKE